MMMTVFDLPPERLGKDRERFENILERNTLFGAGQSFQKKADHAVLQEDWKATPGYRAAQGEGVGPTRHERLRQSLRRVRRTRGL
jgi:hypothetical protein